MITGIVWVCDECGSDNVEAHAYAVWDVEEQRWRFDHAEYSNRDYCYDCDDGVRSLITRKVNLKEIAVSVIEKEEAHA